MISSKGTIKGILNVDDRASTIKGSLSGINQINGTIKTTDNNVLHSSVENSASIQAQIASNPQISCSFTMPETVIKGDNYVGDYSYTPSFNEQIAPTEGKYLRKDIVISEIKTYETSNEYGTTFII